MKHLPLAFADLTPTQQERFTDFERLLQDVNRKINLISRETDEEVRLRHTLHCLAYTLRPFPPGTTLVDWGTGGGLPAIPLAILHPEVTVHAVDAVGKKVQAVAMMARRLGLGNLHAHHARAEQWEGSVHYAVSRATAPLVDLWSWSRPVLRPFDAPPEAWPPALVCLKGGDLTDEVAALRAFDAAVQVDTIPLEPVLGRPYFADKVLVTVAAAG